jgi:hypothetical protein
MAEPAHVGSVRRVLDSRSGFIGRTTRHMDITQIEEWRPVTVADLGDFYEVSNLGRVRSLDRLRMGPGGLQRCDGKILRPRINKVGYPQVNLFREGRCKTINVHRLVALAFVPNPNRFPVVNHIDGVKANPVAVNLEWTTDRLNKQHAIDIGRITRYKKLLTSEEVAEIRSLRGTTTQAEIAKRFGVTQTNISLILLGRTH